MPRTCRVAAAVLSLSVFAAAGCGADPAPSAPPATGSAPAAAAPAAAASPSGGPAFATSVGVTVGLASVGSLGPILVDAQGRALYLYGADTSVHGTCRDECAKSWPPVTTPGFPLAGPGVDDGLLGAAALADGTAQVLYKGHPLYRYTGDHGPGQATGHTVADPHGTFYAVTSLGDPVGVDIATLRGTGGAPSGLPSGAASASASAGATDPAATGATGSPSAPATSTVPAVPSTPAVPYVPPAPTAPAEVQPPRDPGTDPDTGAGSGGNPADPATDAGSGAGSGTDTGSGAGTGTDTGSGAGTGPDTGSDTGSGAGSGSGTSSESTGDPGTGADTGTSTGADTSTGTATSTSTSTSTSTDDGAQDG
ncbi:hypothetical protein [Kitasatospora griseola]|uniref:COG4315 family predicted lipoprotein n=1 Tax=Kitasatospora griseola TaxID=2064 RepID=UPI0006987DC4|nr:hypothetical protein [Kitasatospora griseola]